MSAPAITVLMPVRDGARYLPAAIDSILGQTFRAFEFVIVDDGSTDATPEILRDCAARDPRIVVLRQEPQGIVAARKRCLAEARAPLIACLDADDVALPDRLARQFEVMQANARLGLLGGHAETIDETGSVIGRRSPATRHADLIEVLKRTNPMVTSTTMFRRELAVGLGGYRGAFEGIEDYDLWLRISENSEIANLPESLAHYRINTAGVSARFEARSAFLVRLAKHSAVMRRSGSPDPTDELTSPPDWRRAPANAFYASDARDCSLLELASPEVAETLPLEHLDPAVLRGLPARLNHREKRIAQRALLNLMERTDRPAGFDGMKLWSTFVQLHPLRAVEMVMKERLLPKFQRHDSARQPK